MNHDVHTAQRHHNHDQRAHPAQIATWQRGPAAFSVLIRVDPDHSATVYLTTSITGTFAEAFPVVPGDIIGFDVPAKGAYLPAAPPENLYAFTAADRSATVSVLIEPR